MDVKEGNERDNLDAIPERRSVSEVDSLYSQDDNRMINVPIKKT